MITFLSSSQNANNGGDFCRAKYCSSISNTDPGSARCFQKVMLIFTIMHFPGPWEPTADLAGILYESGCLHSPVKCIPSLNFAGNEPCINITNSSGYLNAKSHQTSGQASGVEQACSALAGFITSVSLMQFNTLCAPGHAGRLSERSHRGGAAGDAPTGESCRAAGAGVACQAASLAWVKGGKFSFFSAMRHAKLIRPLNWHQ